MGLSTPLIPDIMDIIIRSRPNYTPLAEIILVYRNNSISKVTTNRSNVYSSNRIFDHCAYVQSRILYSLTLNAVSWGVSGGVGEVTS